MPWGDCACPRACSISHHCARAGSCDWCRYHALGPWPCLVPSSQSAVCGSLRSSPSCHSLPSAAGCGSYDVCWRPWVVARRPQAAVCGSLWSAGGCCLPCVGLLLLLLPQAAVCGRLWLLRRCAVPMCRCRGRAVIAPGRALSRFSLFSARPGSYDVDRCHVLMTLTCLWLLLAAIWAGGCVMRLCVVQLWRGGCPGEVVAVVGS